MPSLRLLSLFCLLLLLGLLLCPLVALRSVPAPASASAAAQAVSAAAPDSRDRLLGMLAAAMAPTSHPEALKAQAVAAASCLAAGGANPPACWDAAARKAAWGADCAAYEAKLGAAVDAVAGEILTYDGAPAEAVWHALNPGSTCSAEAAWGKAVPYLISVASPGDRLSPALVQTVEVPKADFAQALLAADVACDGAAEDWISALQQSEDGYTARVTVCGTQLTGPQLRAALSLPSSAFTVEYADGSFRFTVRGSGDGVGLSQYGADYMARQGSDYRAILAHYFPGTQLQIAENLSYFSSPE